MAKATTTLSLSGAAYVQLTTSSQKFILEVRSGNVEFIYKATQPADTDNGHWLRDSMWHFDQDPTEKCWVRAKDGLAATIVVTKD